MSEEHIFATLGFSEEIEAKNQIQDFNFVLESRSDYERVFDNFIKPEHFADFLTNATQYGSVVQLQWFGPMLDLKSITENLKSINPKYLAIEKIFDSGASRKSGYIESKKSSFKEVITTLASGNDIVGFTLALQKENTKLVESFLEKGINPNESSFGDEVLLHLYYKKPLITALVKAGARLYVTKEGLANGDTPVHRAILFGSADILKAMLAAGADPNLLNSEGETLLLGATAPCAEKRRMMKILLEADSDPNKVDSQGFSPVLRLVKSTAYNPEPALTSLKLLVKYGANLNYYHPEIGSSLWLAEDGGNKEIINYLIQQGVSSQPPKEKDPAPLAPDSGIISQIEFWSRHEKQSNKLSRELEGADCLWPVNNKDWLKDRKKVWKYIESSISEKFYKSVKAKNLKYLKDYFLFGTELPRGGESGYALVRLLFKVWLHPSANTELLRSLLEGERGYDHLNRSYFMNKKALKSHCSIIGPRNKILAPLLYEECFYSEEDSLERRCIFLNNFANQAYMYLTNGTDIETFDNVEFLIEEFMSCVKTILETGESKFRNEPVTLTVKGKSVRSNVIKMLIERVENFTIDQLPFHKVDSTQAIVRRLEEILPELIKLSKQLNKSKFR